MTMPVCRTVKLAPVVLLRYNLSLVQQSHARTFDGGVVGMEFNSGSPSRLTTELKPRSELHSGSTPNAPQHKEQKGSYRPLLSTNDKSPGYVDKQESEKKQSIRICKPLELSWVSEILSPSCPTDGNKLENKIKSSKSDGTTEDQSQGGLEHNL